MPLTKAQAKSLDILEVARSLGMEMKRKSHRESLLDPSNDSF